MFPVTFILDMPYVFYEDGRKERNIHLHTSQLFTKIQHLQFKKIFYPLQLAPELASTAQCIDVFDRFSLLKSKQ